MAHFFKQVADQGLLIFLARLPPGRARLLLLGLAAVITLAICAAFRGTLVTFEEQVGAIGWKLNPSRVTEERINIIAIDEKSLKELGPWPWPQEIKANLAIALKEAGVQLQVYDIVFPEPREGDELFLRALVSTRAVLSQIPLLQSAQDIRTGSLTHPLTGITCSAETNNAENYLANTPAFAAIPKGHITPLIDTDGAVRKVPAFICVDGKSYPALAISALFAAINAESWGVTVASGKFPFGPQLQLALNSYPGLDIPLDKDGNMRVSFKNDPDAYQVFSAVDVLRNRIDRELLEGTWALVGYSAFGLGVGTDTVPTPFNGTAPGVELQARMLSSLLDNNTPFTPTAAPLLLVLLSIAFSGFLYWCSGAHERLGRYGLPLSAILFPSVAIMLHAQLLSEFDIWIGWLAPALYSVCAASLLILYGYAKVSMERSRVLNNLSSYLPVDVAKEIAYTLPNSSINARRQDATLLCADLRNFSTYGEARPPEEAAALLHYFFVRTTEVIEKHQGRVHEFKGDSLLAIWDGSGSHSAGLALKAAVDMQAAIWEILQQAPPAGLEPLALGISIEQGPVLIGSIGPAHRRSHTLLGETVTITLRIQDMTVELAQPILIGECASRQLTEYGLESQGSYLLSGLKIPHTLFAPRQGDTLTPKMHREQPPFKLLLGGKQ
jgi:adenylate cyclase